MLGGLPPDLRGVFLIPGKRISRGPPPFRASKFAGTDPAGGTVGGRKEGRRFIPGEARGWMDRKSKWMGTERNGNGTGTGTEKNNKNGAFGEDNS